MLAETTTTTPGDTIIALTVLALIFAAYWAPTVIAAVRQHHQLAPIIIVNGLLGWTFLGWVGALAWCFTPTAADRQVVN